MVRVADLIGRVRTESFGRFAFRRSADFVSIRRRLGTLGRRGGGGGRRKPTCDGGGEGLGSRMLALWVGVSRFSREEDIAPGINGIGERGGGDGALVDVTEEGSISGNAFDRKAACVSSWKSPPPFFNPPPPACGGGESTLKPKSNSPPEDIRVSRSG
jgi:hypothetical protein